MLRYRPPMLLSTGVLTYFIGFRFGWWRNTMLNGLLSQQICGMLPSSPTYHLSLNLLFLRLLILLTAMRLIIPPLPILFSSAPPPMSQILILTPSASAQPLFHLLFPFLPQLFMPPLPLSIVSIFLPSAPCFTLYFPPPMALHTV